MVIAIVTAQGQEKNDEIKGEGSSLNYKYRMHDPRVGRFFAVDPLTKEYPHYTPYSFSGNKVTNHIELEGLEEFAKVDDSGQDVTRNDRSVLEEVAKGPLSDITIEENEFTHMVERTPSIDVGKQIVNNNTNLIKRPKSTPVAETFEARNTFSNCGGDCFAATEARVRKAFIDVGAIDKLPDFIEGKNKNRYSKLFSVTEEESDFLAGGARALSELGFGGILTNEDILAGKAKPGAVMQVWTHETVAESVKAFNSISGGNYNLAEGGGWGHSFILLDDIFDKNGNLTAFKVLEQHGTNRVKEIAPYKIFRGINVVIPETINYVPLERD